MKNIKYFCIYLFFDIIFISILYPQTRFSLSLSQSAVNDWKQGEIRALELNTGFDSKNIIKFDTLLIDLNIKLGLGVQYNQDEKKRQVLFSRQIMNYSLNS